MPFPFLAVAIGAGISAISAVGKAKERTAAYEQRLQDLNQGKERLDQGFSQAQASYKQATAHAEAQAKEKKDELSLLSSETIANRDMALKQTGELGSMESQLQAMQLATLSVQNRQEVGKATMQAAASGFRGNNSALGIVEATQAAQADAMTQARMQAKLSNRQTYAKASQSYISSTQQAEGYQREIERTGAELSRTLEGYDLQMAQAKATYDLEGGFLRQDVGYMKTTGKKAMDWANIGGGLADVGSGAMNAYVLFK